MPQSMIDTPSNDEILERLNELSVEPGVHHKDVARATKVWKDNVKSVTNGKLRGDIRDYPDPSKPPAYGSDLRDTLYLVAYRGRRIVGKWTWVPWQAADADIETTFEGIADSVQQGLITMSEAMKNGQKAVNYGASIALEVDLDAGWLDNELQDVSYD